jgi:hypothetical protein
VSSAYSNLATRYRFSCYFLPLNIILLHFILKSYFLEKFDHVTNFTFQISKDDNALAVSVAKRIPDPGAASNASLETSSKKQLSLTCKVCGTTANSDKAMHYHLNGKGHKRKAEALSAQPPSAPKKPDPEADEVEEEDAPSRDFKPTKFTMVTNKGTLNQVTQMDGYLLCEVCNVRTADRVTMMCHFGGTKHISKSKTRRRATGDRSIELQDTMVTWANKDMTAMESSKAPGMEAANVSRGPLAVVVNTVGGSELEMEVDGVRHPLRRVEGFLLCPCCDVKVTTDIVMQSHLVGKKHKNKMKLAEAGVGGKGTSVAATLGQEQGSVPKMSLAGGDAGSEAVVVSVTAPTVPADATTEPAGKPFKIQVEGRLFTVLQENNRFSCEPCGVRCCNKDSMVKHLYTSTHWEKASLAE